MSASGVEGDPGTSASGGAERELPGTPERDVPPKGTINRVTEHKHTGVPVSDQQFQNFWWTYPSRGRHSNPKKPARAKFDAALKRGVSGWDIIRGAQNYASYLKREGTDPKYVAQAKTWLNEERWAQYHEEAANEPTPLML